MNISWLKLDVNILDDSKIKIIRSFPDGDSLVVLWIGLLCLAMKSNDPGVLRVTEALPYTIDDLHNLLSIEKKTIELGLGLFTKYQMIEQLPDGAIEIINFTSRQNLELIEHKREQTRLRVAKHREKVSNALLTHYTVTGNATDKNKNKKENKNKNNPPTPRKRGNDYSPDFLTFWKEYPKKAGKDAAWNAWKKRNGDRPAIDVIMKAIEEQKRSDQWTRDGGQFIKNPATWINQGCWEDELPEKQFDGGTHGSRYPNRNRIPEPITRETQEGIDRINRMARELAQRQALDKAKADA